MQPELLIPVGRLAIEQFLPPAPLNEIIGKKFDVTAFGQKCEVIPLPHPSGASTWFKREPGITLLAQALELLSNHPAWRQMVEQTRP